MATAQEKASGLLTSNVGAYSEGALQLRLATEQLLDSIELYVTGYQIRVAQAPSGELVTVKEKVTNQLANAEGKNNVMGYLRAIINTAAVQGNFKMEQYEDYIFMRRMELNKMLFNNLYDYGIEERNYPTIIDFIMSLIIPFMSRLIDNKERESYAQTIKTTESATLEQKKGVLPF